MPARPGGNLGRLSAIVRARKSPGIDCVRPVFRAHSSHLGIPPGVYVNTRKMPSLICTATKGRSELLGDVGAADPREELSGEL